MIDFRDTMWLPAKWLLAGGDPYNGPSYAAAFPYAQDFPTYAPGHLALSLPFGWLPWDAAMATDLALNVVVMVAVGIWAGLHTLRQWRAPSRSAVAESVAAAALGVAVLWSARTAAVAVGFGQPSVVYALLVAPALMVKRPATAVALTAITCLKPHIGIFVIIVLLAQRRWRTALYGATVAAGASLVVAMAIAGGPGGLIPWLQTLGGNVNEASARRSVEYLGERIDVVGSALDAGLPVPSWLTVPILVLGLLGAFWATRWATHRDLPCTGIVLGLSIALLSFYHMGYDAMWLLAPIAFAFVELVKYGQRRDFFTALPGLGALAVAAWASRWHPIDVHFGDGTTIVVMRVLLIAGTVALAVGVRIIARGSTVAGGAEQSGSARVDVRRDFVET